MLLLNLVSGLRVSSVGLGLQSLSTMLHVTLQETMLNILQTMTTMSTINMTRVRIVMNMTGMMSMTSMLTMAYIIRSIVKLVIFIMDHTLHQNLTDLSSAGSSSSLNFMTWNASGIMSSGSYLGCILQRYDVDFCGVSEHWLYKKE